MVGVRLPWTMENEDVWNKTNMLMGKLFVASGLLSLIGVFFPGMVTFIILIGSILLSSLIAAIYSMLLFKKSGK